MLARIGAVNIGDDGAVEFIVNREDKGRGAVLRLRRRHAAAFGESLLAVVAGAGLAADGEDAAIAQDDRFFRAAGCAFLDHAVHFAAGEFSDFFGQYARALRV